MVASVTGRLVVAGRGEASEPQMSLFPAAARSAVRYADPLTWTAATAVARAFAQAGEPSPHARDRVAVIGMSENGPAQAIAAVAEASAAGFSSPMRYPAANPGSLCGVICIVHGFRGPSTNLVMPPLLALPVGLLLANAWINRQSIPMVVLTACTSTGARAYIARSLILSCQDRARSEDARPLTAEHEEWLRFTRPQAN